LKNPFRYDWLVLEAGGGEGLAEWCLSIPNQNFIVITWYTMISFNLANMMYSGIIYSIMVFLSPNWPEGH
jgi:hypothetical protein